MKNEWLQEFWQYRELFFFMVWRNIKIRYKQTALGACWAIIQPFCTMIVFTIFFGKFAEIPSDDIPYPIFSYSGLLPWTYFSVVLALAGNSLVSNANLVTKVYFPRLILPASSALSGLVDFAIAFTVLLGMMVYYDFSINWGLLLWPILLLPLFLLVLGASMILASLNVKYRDVKYAIPFVIQSWLFITPVIYPTSIIPERYRFLAAFNPLTGLIEAFRASMLPTRQVDWSLLGISVFMILCIFIFGLLYFKKTERYFADIV